MSDAIIVALITGACAVIAQLIISYNSTKQLYNELDKRSEISDTAIQGKLDVINTRINNLTEEVKKHNGIMERTYKLEERVENNTHRIDNLEKAG